MPTKAEIDSAMERRRDEYKGWQHLESYHIEMRIRGDDKLLADAYVAEHQYGPDESTPTSSDATLIAALRILARDIQSEDGVANAAIDEAATRLEVLSNENAAYWRAAVDLESDDVSVSNRGAEALHSIRTGNDWSQHPRTAVETITHENQRLAKMITELRTANAELAGEVERHKKNSSTE